jgi:hypothetical protein
MKKLSLVALIFALLAGGVVVGCGFGPDESREDATDTKNVDKTEPEAIAFNNHFPNVETKCDQHGHRIFVSTHDSSTGNNLIVLPDPTCPGYVKGQEPPVVVSP